jgi:hypothetical protein
MYTWGEKSPPLIFEVRGLPRRKDDPTTMDDYEGERIGVVIECEHGRFAGGGGGGWVYDNDGKKVKQFKGDGGKEHAANFIRAIRDRNANILRANAKEGHLSSCLCHMANISYRMGVAAPAERFKMELVSQWNKQEAYNEYERMIAHMKANELDMNADSPVLGKMLMLHARMEQFIGIGATTANSYLKGNYRNPYVVPPLGQAGTTDGSSY